MKSTIVADGEIRFAETPEYRARRRELEQAVAARYAARLAEAGFFHRLFICFLRHRELQRELRKITPSAESCWFATTSSHSAASSQREEHSPG
jgi:hypothetical protein